MTEILIVDDQLTSRMILEKLAASLGDEAVIHSFADPLDALDHAAGAAPDLAFVDYKMPRIDGVEFINRFRLLPECRDAPLVMVTALEDRNVRYRALEAGATDFLTKPIDHHEFQARARNMLTMRKQQKIIRDRAKWLELKVEEATREILTREKETLLRLAKAGEYRDEITGNHVLRMARYSRIIAEELGLPERDCQIIEMAAPLHDIGKIGVSDTILLKNGKLTRAEIEIVKTHTKIGYEILKESPSEYLQMGATIALWHHEKFDGTGYPDGLRGDEIPLVARIVAVSDVYDAMTTNRPYKSAWMPHKVIDSIVSDRGSHFDPQCVDAFITRIDRIMEVHLGLRDKSTPSPRTLAL
jgi:two-component system, response regulator RpfG